MLIKSGDEQLRMTVEEALAGEPLLGDCCVDAGAAGGLRGAVVLFPEGYSGHIGVDVEGGVVTLHGEVPGPREQRLAVRIARRLPGCQAVVNRLEAPPPPSSAIVVPARRRRTA